MAKCIECSRKLGFWKESHLRTCPECANRTGGTDPLVEQENAAIDAILVVTAPTLGGIRVDKYLGFVSAECAYGMNMFKDMFANVRNLVGGRSAAVEDTMRDSRETVLLELKREAHAKGANAVIAVDLDYTQLGAGGNMMVLVSTSGTAVVIEE
jgi:uncharacterized protein YbjQ (UPF0145 family)